MSEDIMPSFYYINGVTPPPSNPGSLLFFIEENELKKISLGWKDGSNYLLNSFSSDKQQELSDLSIGLSEANTKIGNLEKNILTLQSNLNNISLTPGPKGDKGDTGSQGPAGIFCGVWYSYCYSRF